MAMALLYLPKLLITLIFLLVITCVMMMTSHSDAAQIDDTSSSINLFTEALEYNWPSAALYDEEEEEDDDEFGHLDVGVNDMGGRRSLFWRRLRRYYISYGVLFANRIPCPPRSGRSYYTHNCYKASGPAHPYTRGCSAITRCRS